MINFTASHNKHTDDGFKFSPHHGGAAEKEVTDKISEYANAAKNYYTADYEKALELGKITEMKVEDAVKEYVEKYLMPRLKELGAWESIVDYMVNFIAEFSKIKIPPL